MVAISSSPLKSMKSPSKYSGTVTDGVANAAKLSRIEPASTSMPSASARAYPTSRGRQRRDFVLAVIPLQTFTLGRGLDATSTALRKPTYVPSVVFDSLIEWDSRR